MQKEISTSNLPTMKRSECVKRALDMLEVGEALKAPYKYFATKTMRNKASELKAEQGKKFHINATASDVYAIITREA